MSEIVLPATLGGEAVHPMTALCYEMLGSALTKDDQSSGWLMLMFMDSLVHELKPVWDLVLDSETTPGGWDLFNPDAMAGQTLPWLPWLMQFTGDYYDTSVIGIDPGAVSPDQILRDKVKHKRQWHRGTLDVLEETVLERLPLGATVTITDRVNGDISHLSVTVLAGGIIPDPLLVAIYQALYASIPAGDSFDLTILIGPSYASLEGLLNPDSYAQFQHLYPTYDSLPSITQTPYAGPLPPAAVGNVQITTWQDIEVYEQNWARVESYGTWQNLEGAGTT
jgi:hypothetical protein